MVKQYEKDGKQHVLLRLYAGGKLNYHDFELIKKGKEVKAADVFNYVSGDNMSKTLAESMDYLKDNISSIKENTLQDIKRYIKLGQYEEAEAEFIKLSPALRNQKLFQVVNIQIASGLGDAAYKKAIEDYNTLYPNEPNMHLMMIDYYFVKNDYVKTLEAVEKLDRLIDKDPFLDYYRGLILNVSDEKQKAQEKYEQLITNMPHFAPGMAELLIIYLKDKNYEKAVPLLKRYRAEPTASDEVLASLYISYPELKSKFPRDSL